MSNYYIDQATFGHFRECAHLGGVPDALLQVDIKPLSEHWVGCPRAIADKLILHVHLQAGDQHPGTAWVPSDPAPWRGKVGHHEFDLHAPDTLARVNALLED